MVFVKPILGMVLDALRVRLECAGGDPLVHGLASWLELCEPMPAPLRPAVWNYQCVAVLGLSPRESDDLFIEGVNWLCECKFFKAGVIRGFEADPLAMLAVGVGLSRFPDHPAGAWLSSLVGRAIDLERNSWRRTLLLATKQVLGETVDWGSADAEVAVALEGRGLCEVDAACRDRALTAIMKLEHDEERAVVQLSALEHLLSMAGSLDIHRPSANDVVAILNRVPAALKRWPWEDAPKTRKEGVTAQRWDMQVEDHVQSLLYAILRPVFTDIDDEEYLKSVGHKRPRADFVIPSLRLVVEVKFLRKATQSARAKVLEEVAADTGLYLNDGTAYNTMVVFVWDDTGSIHHHAELVTGLDGLPGVVGAVIVPRPGSWNPAMA